MDALIQLQYTVLATIISFPSHVGETLTRLSVADFPYPPARGIYAAIGELHFAGEPINWLTVFNKAGDEYGEALNNASEFITSGLELDYYVEQLKEKSRMRTIQGFAKQIASAERLDVIENLVGDLNAAIANRQQLQIVKSGDAALEFCNSQSAPAPSYYRWGFAKLDQSLYVEQGDFVVIGGYSSAGKTLLSLQFAKTLAETHRVGYFTLETSPKKLTDRLIAHMGRIPLSAIKDHNLNDEQWTAAAQAANDLSLLHLDFIPASGMTVRDIQAIALSQRYEAIFVDYLQLIQAKGGSRYEIVTNISSGLHTMAQAHGITVIALAQLSRPEQNKDGKQPAPSMHSFRESGQIEQDADVALLLYQTNPNDYRSRRMLKCGKNKDGERFALELDFDGPLQTFSVPQPPQTDSRTPDWVRACEQEDGPSFFQGR